MTGPARVTARARAGSRLAALALALAGAAFACVEAGPVAQECTGIPEGGCPLSRGVACDDPACLATYACRPGNVWELRDTCPPREASAEDATDTDAADASTELTPVPDAPPGAYGGPGCGDLQLPDCSLGLALSCGEGCCGCEDLFVCGSLGWEHWGDCTSGRPTPPP